MSRRNYSSAGALSCWGLVVWDESKGYGLFIISGQCRWSVEPVRLAYQFGASSTCPRWYTLASTMLESTPNYLANFSKANIGYKTYIVFVIQDFIQAALWYTIMPETKQRTLEELDEIFAASKPVKHSLKAHKLAVNSDRQVVAVEAI